MPALLTVDVALAEVSNRRPRRRVPPPSKLRIAARSRTVGRPPDTASIRCFGHGWLCRAGSARRASAGNTRCDRRSRSGPSLCRFNIRRKGSAHLYGGAPLLLGRRHGRHPGEHGTERLRHGAGSGDRPRWDAGTRACPQSRIERPGFAATRPASGPGARWLFRPQWAMAASQYGAPRVAVISTG